MKLCKIISNYLRIHVQRTLYIISIVVVIIINIM